MKLRSKKVLFLLFLALFSIILISTIKAIPPRGDDCRSCHEGHAKFQGTYPMTTNKNGTTVLPGATFTITITLTLSNTPWAESDAYLYFQPGKGNNDDFTFVPNTPVQDNTPGLDSNPADGDMSVTFTVTAPTAEGWYDAKAYAFLKGQGSEPGEGVGPLHADIHTWIQVVPPLQGPPGPKGEQGPAGPAGPQGPPGPGAPNWVIYASIGALIISVVAIAVAALRKS